MLSIKTINTTPIFPIRFKNALNLKGEFAQTSDGYSFFNYDILNNIQDAALQKNSGLLLTKDKSIDNLYQGTKTKIDSFKLNDYAYLRFDQNDYYLTFKNENIAVSHVYTTDDFIYFKVNYKNRTISLIHDDLYFTVSRDYPYVIKLEPKKYIDYYQQQDFLFVQEEDRIVLLAHVIDSKTNKETRRYVSYSPRSKELRATGLQMSDLRVSEYCLKLDRRVDSFYTPDYIPQSYAVEYYNNFQDTNTTTTEIANKIPINNINFLVHVPYKNSTTLTQNSTKQYFDINTEIVALKNILTPAYTVAKMPKPPLITGFDPASIFFDLDIDARYNPTNNIIVIDAKSIPSSIIKTGVFPTDIYRYSIQPQNYKINLPYFGGKNIRDVFSALTKKRIIGIAANGVYFNNFCSTESLTSKDGREVYDFDLVFTKLSGIDFAGGAPDNNNIYKYYTGEFIFNDIWDDFISLNEYYNFSLEHFNGHSKIVGIALDGYPIYGPYGYKIPTDNLSRVVPMRSSYRLLSSTKTQRPPLSTYPVGTFAQDYTYNPSYGDLDACNGRFCVTPEYPNGTYAYFLTLDTATKKPVFPYILGNLFYGKTIYESATSIDPGTGQPFVPPTIPIKNITITVPLSNIYNAGRNINGQLLDGTRKDFFSFKNTLTGGWNKVACGGSHTLLLSGTDLFVGGNNIYGQIGLTTRGTSNTTPVLIPGQWEDIFTTNNCSFAADLDGNLFGTGDNRFYQLGRSDLPQNYISQWTRVLTVEEDNASIKKVVGGPSHTLCLKTNNKLFITGSNEDGQLGVGEDTKLINNWVIIPGGSRWLDIAAGTKHSIGIAADGKIYGTGYNEFGEAGTEELKPVYEWTQCNLTPPITGIDPNTGAPLYSPWKKVACGEYSSYALAENGDLFSIGRNNAGQLGIGSSLGYIFDWTKLYGKWDDITAGKEHIVALSAGDLYVAGNSNLGQLGLGFKNIIQPTLTKVTQSSGNLVRSSNEPEDWQFGGGNILFNPRVVTGPFGERDATILTVDQPGSTYYVLPYVNSGILLPNETYTMSVFVKHYEIPAIKWEVPSEAERQGLRPAIFDVANRTVIDGNTARIQHYNNGWIRCIMTFRTPVNPIRRNLYLQATTPGRMGIYGFQIEHGPEVTPYQPTSMLNNIPAEPRKKILWNQIAAGGTFTYVTARDTFVYTVTAFDV